MPKLLVSTRIPSDSIFRYEAKVRQEGCKKKGGLTFVVPAQCVRGLRHLGWPGGWLRARINGAFTFYGYVRRSPRSARLSLPRWCRGNIQAGDIVHVEACDPSPWRHGTETEWAAEMETFTAMEGGRIVVHTRYGPPLVVAET